MRRIEGAFEFHLTVAADSDAEGLSRFAQTHELTVLTIHLEAGTNPVQPMVTGQFAGEVVAAQHYVWQLERGLRAAGFDVVRRKLEANPGNVGVPMTDDQAFDQLPGRYFEHHVKVLLEEARRPALVAAADARGARVASNALRTVRGGRREWFVTQRVFGVGRSSAEESLAELDAGLRRAGFEVLSAEQEFVVSDSRLSLDEGWLDVPPGAVVDWETWRRTRPAGVSDYPSTYLPPARSSGAVQRAVFDPALAQFGNAFRAGDPVFVDAGPAERWYAARRSLRWAVAAAAARSGHGWSLVLRGSALLQAWLGREAREPGDLDYLVTPTALEMRSGAGAGVLGAFVDAATADDVAGLGRPRVAAVEEIWTYERVPGTRLMFALPVAGCPEAMVQVDVVFGENLLDPPVPVLLPGLSAPVPGASAALSLAWKIRWLVSDAHPQGKDLYDAVLLAELGAVQPELIRAVLAQDAPTAAAFTPRNVEGWDVDWVNFETEHPHVTGDLNAWKLRCIQALTAVTWS